MEPFTSNSGRKGFMKNAGVTTQPVSLGGLQFCEEKTHEYQLSLGRQD